MVRRLLLRISVGIGALAVVVFAAHWAALQPAVYIRLVLAVTERQSINRDKIDWPTVRREVLERVKGARTPAETRPAIWHLIRHLNDGHSHILPAEMRGGEFKHVGFYAMHPENVVARVFKDGAGWRAGVRERDVIELVDGQPPRGGTEIDLPRDSVRLRVRSHATGEVREVAVVADILDQRMLATGRMLGADVGYLDLPQAFPGYIPYSEALLDLIRDFDGRNVTAWVIDLRRNEGGDMWSMLRGLRPIVGEGKLGYHLRPESESANFMDDALHVLTAGYLLRPGSKVPWELQGDPMYRLRHPDPPVAVLLSRRTASSAESVAIAFRGLPTARSFGEPTYGQTISNLTLPLPDGTLYQLADAVSVDRTGREFRGQVPPDEPLPIDWGKLGQDDDPVLNAALAWLEQMK